MRMWKSIHEDLAPLEVIHRGFGGSTMDQVLVFKDFLARYQAKEIVVYEGDNDISSDPASVNRFVKNCRDFIEYMNGRQPDVVIHFISPKPSIARWDNHLRYEEARKQLKALVDEYPNVHYIDVTAAMLDGAGNPRQDIFLGDNLHMNDIGYDIWEKVVREHFDLPAR